MIENEVTEFKEILNDSLEKEVVAFLNSTHGGSIYIGVNDNGDIIGIDDIDSVALKAKDRIKNNIRPNTIGLFEICILEKDGKYYLEIDISCGNQRPYYIKRYGRSPEGCFYRLGTSVQQMTEARILDYFKHRTQNSLLMMESPNQKLTFNYLIRKYEDKGFEVNNNFLSDLELYNFEDNYNYLAYLLSDQNKLQFQFARYNSDDIFDLIEQKTFTNQSIIRTTDEIIELFLKENSKFTKITGLGREEVEKFSSIAVREIIVNALVHNNYKTNGLPTFEEFTNHFEISSFGGLPDGFLKDDFLNGYSLPVNPELMRVFRDLGYAERLGTGIRRVLKFYPKEIFFFSPNFIRVNIPFKTLNRVLTSDNLEDTILNILRSNPSATRKEISIITGKSESMIYREISRLIDEKKLKRVGSTKSGTWIVK